MEEQPHKRHIAVINHNSERYYVVGRNSESEEFILSKRIKVNINGQTFNSCLFYFENEIPDLTSETEFEFNGSNTLTSIIKSYVAKFIVNNTNDATFDYLEQEVDICNNHIKELLEINKILRMELELLADTKAFIKQSEELAKK